MHTTAMTGIVVEEWKNYCVVDTAVGRFRATPLGALRKRFRRICVGDRVELRVTNSDTFEALVMTILPRRTYLPRPPMANLDLVVFVNTVREPAVSYETIDRFLLNAELHELVTVIVINKIDLFNKDDHETARELRATYERVGYTVLASSAQTGEGLDSILTECRGKISCVAGVSGVGKSSLLRRIFPDHEFRTRELSEKLERGVHTTTHTTLLRHDQGSYIADTPGFSFIDLPSIDTADLVACFPEINQTGTRCRF
ncbi:MAG: ribosome small subunit-dependent GTPase A, partial [Chitinivibrionales bacterium]|nr:ribosome small subunit-dependent GTPase A [Chitinivibrionales bacterium]